MGPLKPPILSNFQLQDSGAVIGWGQDRNQWESALMFPRKRRVSSHPPRHVGVFLKDLVKEGPLAMHILKGKY